MKIDCIERQLSRLFYHYGKLIARQPLPFLIIPIIVSVGLTIGVLNLEEVKGTEALYTPRNGPAKEERETVQRLFPENDTYFFDASRRSDLIGYLRLCFVGTADHPNVFTAEAMDEIIQIDTLLKSYEISHNDMAITYLDVCGNWKGACSENILLELLAFDPANVLSANLSYPVHDDGHFLGMQIGGVETDDDDGTIISAKAVLLSYYVAYQTESDIEGGNAWISGVSSHLLASGLQKYSYVRPSLENSLSMDEELDRATGNIVPLFSIAYTLLMTFAAISTSMKDWVRSKTWVAIGGEVSVVLAVGSSLGFLSLCGVYFTSTVGTMPFLIVGIGIDNMFVLVSSWRHTNYLEDVESRMGKTCEKAAVSISLTTLTDALAFGIGAYTSFLSIELFCLYTLVAVLFSYAYTITFLLACMVFSGRREEQNKHVFTCRKATKEEDAGSRSSIHKIFCVGGDSLVEDEGLRQRALEDNVEKLTVPQLSVFLGTSYAEFLLKTPTKIAVLIIYLAYIGCAVWGCVTLEEGLQLQNLAPDDSYLVPFYEGYNPYFSTQWGPRTMVIATETLEYNDPDISQQVHTMVKDFMANEFYFDEEQLTSSWLRDFETYIELRGISIHNNSHFIDILRNEFLLFPQFEQYMLDITFNDQNTEIIASRFLVQARGIESAIQEKELVLDVRDLASRQPFYTTVYHAAFIFYDQYVVIVSNTIRNLGMAAACMLLVAILLLPHPLAVVWVTVSVISICTGVVGFMTFWDVNLDSISMINLTMCIGFSVDFSGHICYHYTVADGTSAKQRIKEALQHLGFPILQGGLSTILGVCVLAFSNSYIFRTFFKLVFLVMIFGLLHAMVLLPVVLSVVGPGVCSKQSSSIDLKMSQIETKGRDNEGLDHNGCNTQKS